MKKSIRNNALRDLRALSDGVRIRAGEAVARKLDAWCRTLENPESHHVALYRGTGHEMNTQAVDDVLRSHGLVRHYPRIDQGRMSFRQLPHDWPAAKMKSGTYGIPEPEAHWPVSSPAELDLVLAPAVLVNLQGQRLGQGGGFYDRFLSSLRNSAHPPLVVALVLDEQIATSVPVDAQDQPIDGLMSPLKSGWVEIPPSFYRQDIINLLPSGL